jgi:hypothetical protein
MTLTVVPTLRRETTAASQSHRFDLAPDQANLVTFGSEGRSFTATHIWVMADGKNGGTLDFVDKIEVIAYGRDLREDAEDHIALSRELSRSWHSGIGHADAHFSSMPGFIHTLIRERTPLTDLFDHHVANPEFYLSDPRHPWNIYRAANKD